MKNKIKLITASAGSGKTHKLQETLADFVNPANPKKIRPEGVIATTFTKKAALELKERTRQALIEKGFFDEAVRLEGALISTVHSVCTKIIEMFCYDSGLSPKIEVLPEDDQAIYFNHALASVLTPEISQKMENLKQRIIYADKTEPFDWRDEVKKIIDHARSNAIDSKGLQESFEYSWESLESCLPEKMKDSKAFEAQVISEGTKIIADFEALPKMTGKDQVFLDLLKPFIRYLQNGWNIQWDDWASLSGKSLDATGKKMAASYQGLLADYLKHPQFHEDYENFMKELFSLAGKALDAYQKYKTERGLVDYVDMECLVSQLLDDKTVQKRMSEEFDLLMVDEFQDTNPIQLSIFLKLSRVIPNVIWVGDQKQSIYGFRGADPALMSALLEKMKGNIEIDTLSDSYRSRPALVEHSNVLFTKAFKGLLPEEQIKLNAKRTDKEGHKTAMEVWRIQPLGKGHENSRSARGVAREIQNLLGEKRIIAQKNKPEEILREVTYKDIAVLCKSNEACTKMASYLSELGLPVSLEQNGLLNLPESKLMIAALRYYAFPKDSLAVMEMKLLMEGKDNVEELIEERMKFVLENKHADYGKDFWAVARIDELRNLNLNLSPLEVVNHLLIKLELQRIVNSWEGNINRWNNLILFRDNAQKFEDYCKRLKIGATLGGFLLWMEERNNNGLLKYGADEENAITVMTWHKSKGLEWPVVVLADCHKEIIKSPFGLKVISKSAEFDLENPLKGRILRFWFSFLQKSRKSPFLESLNCSEDALNNVDMCLKEAKRVLYVIFTRARDYLIIPLNSTAQATYFAEVLEDEDVDFPKETGLHKLGWAPKAREVLVKHIFEVPEALPFKSSETHTEVIMAMKGPEVFEPYLINPSKQEPVPGATATLFGTYGKRLTVKGSVDDDKLGDCLHDIAALVHLSKVEVERVLKNYNLQNNLQADEIVKQMELFEAFMVSKGFKNARREIPAVGKVNGRFVNGVVDLLMDDEEGKAVIVDHKSYRGTSLEDKALGYSGQMKVYAGVLKGRSFIHFVSLGEVWELGLG